jgi:hypothetical protein
LRAHIVGLFNRSNTQDAASTEIETDLISRRTRAVERGWLGEIEGIEMTLRFLRDKRNEATGLAQNPPVILGMPARGSGSSSPPC